jgi:diketogulonate reductase-like aldo/keto reductase
MVENISVFDFKLTNDEIARISALDMGHSAAYDDQDPENTRWIGTMNIHE